MDWSSLGALPLGLVFFAGTAFGFVRRRRGYVLARAEYPALAADLGLSHRPSRYATGVGTLSGSAGPYKIMVDPDEQRRIWLSWTTAPGLVLHHRPDTRRPPAGLLPVRFKNQRVAAFFPTSLASVEAALRFGEGKELEPFVRAVAEIRELKEASVTDAGISLTFDFGSPPFIPAQVVRSVVPALIQLAQILSPS